MLRAQSLSEQLLFATVRLDVHGTAGSNGSGTAFVFRHRKGRATAEYLVSARHVVENARSLGVSFHQRQGDGPRLTEVQRHAFDTAQSPWHFHPDPDVDVAVTPLAPIEAELARSGTQIYHCAIDVELVPDADDLAQCDAIEEIVFIGYPNGIWDRKHHLPIVRRGCTATPVVIDFEQTPRFLVDAAVFGGSSGSPVFIFNPGEWVNRHGQMVPGNRLLFVGVVGSVYFRSALNEVIDVPQPAQQVRRVARDREMLDLGMVFKSRCVVEAIEAIGR